MKKILFIGFLLLTACTADEPKVDNTKILASEKKIGALLDELDSDKTSLDRKGWIVCEEFPKVYKTEYMPSLIEYNSKTGGGPSEKYYLDDLKDTTERYKELYKMDCASDANSK
ncbi:hypothetical protein [Acinetobacter sp. ANC 3832]|uniref:hypothetical protein n=1 Tax=Acinetobacter sp. ANC 3832 TaxID=1977874 RepID=UPI000A34CEFC|nr:hypothetical protein [Acinetobacter sp. ANC 3832]OTG89824.1 hypothetical protein B9T35_16280 [Acinetobacter sp. ANC 3832]